MLTTYMCGKCGQRMRPEKTGMWVVSMFLKPATPYKLHRADLWRCQDCDAEMIVVNADSLYEHFQEPFWPTLREIVEKEEIVRIMFERPDDQKRYSTDIKTYVKAHFETIKDDWIISLIKDEYDE